LGGIEHGQIRCEVNHAARGAEVQAKHVENLRLRRAVRAALRRGRARIRQELVDLDQQAFALLRAQRAPLPQRGGDGRR